MLLSEKQIVLIEERLAHKQSIQRHVQVRSEPKARCPRGERWYQNAQCCQPECDSFLKVPRRIQILRVASWPRMAFNIPR